MNTHAYDANQLKIHLGYTPAPATGPEGDRHMLEYANLKLYALGLPTFGEFKPQAMGGIAESIVKELRHKQRMLTGETCPADLHIEAFLREVLGNRLDASRPILPRRTLTLDRHGLARALSLPPDRDTYESPILRSFRTHQGVCHNPAKDRRTTEGVFHVCAGGFAVPADKREVPKDTFAAMLKIALNPPADLLNLPFTSSQSEQAGTFLSLLLRPKVCPEVPGIQPGLTMETRFFAPGSMASNLDFVESVFGNAGDPYQPENDARLDLGHWSGHTGCVILAPHLIRARKKDVGLPHVSKATPRQVREGMCWEKEDELYNGGGAFKLTCRDHRGVVVTLIADNYFGYCKKEVKTQLSYAANLMGQVEEEHAGGAVAFPAYDLGESFRLSDYYKIVDHTFDDVVKAYGDRMDVQPEGYGIDRTHPDIVYVPENVNIDLRHQTIIWTRDGEHTIRLEAGKTYMLPSGYKVEMLRPHQGMRWRLMGTTAEGTFCHKPCTVSGGGKSEISKSIVDATIHGPVILMNFKEDMQKALEIIRMDVSHRYRQPTQPGKPGRPLLSPLRSLGSVVRLLTPHPDFTDEYNAWLRTIPRSVRDLVLTIKRFYKPDWAEDWPSRFTVDMVNGVPDFELKYRKTKLVQNRLRVGYNEDGSWRLFSLRKDFWAAAKLQTEDDISASVVLPADRIPHLAPGNGAPSRKFVTNCEYRLFQRPDEAIHRGYDKQAELDFGRKANFFSNYEPLPRAQAKEMVEDAIGFDEYSAPMQQVIRDFLATPGPEYVISTACPRLINGKPSANPRYLQNRPDLDNPRAWYLAEMGLRLHRRVPADASVPVPVDAVMPGRRNNPADPEAGIRPLAVYSPIHYQELPELFMDFIASLTGKSPSTTGAGSEGALTKGPFNAMPMIIDLNNALVSYILCGHHGFTTAAGYIGHKYRVDHDVSLLIPEVWSRMHAHEREPAYLIEHGFLEKVEDFEYEGRTIPASRLGYRITGRFVSSLFGRIFSHPEVVISPDMLRPEEQSMEYFVDGVLHITEAQQRVAQHYLDDGTVGLACPPLKALLHIMATGSYEGQTLASPELRALFTRESMLASEWYQARLRARAWVEHARLESGIRYLEKFLADPNNAEDAAELDIPGRLAAAKSRLDSVKLRDPVKALAGTLGTDPSVLAT